MQQYILSYTLNLAPNQLLYSEMRISEVVMELSFTDESHLNKPLIKVQGMQSCK